VANHLQALTSLHSVINEMGANPGSIEVKEEGVGISAPFSSESFCSCHCTNIPHGNVSI